MTLRHPVYEDGEYAEQCVCPDPECPVDHSEDWWHQDFEDGPQERS